MTAVDDPRTKAKAAFAAAVTSSQQNLLVIAPPGCGKTELLARRAAHLIDRLEPNQKILALTYSNKAKANLSARLTEVLGFERRRRYVVVRNFHGHATEILRSHGRTLNLDTEFEQPDKNQLQTALAPYLDGLDDSRASALAGRVEEDLRAGKQHPYCDHQVIDWLRDHGHPASLEIEEARQEAGTPYFDDLLRHAQRLIRVSEIAALYQEHYGAVLVDEFQDLSPQQLDIALRSCSRSRTLVGDPLQGIYTWAGARPALNERLLRRLCGAPQGLGHSYRSSPKVLALLNAIAAELGGPALESIEPEAWHQGGAAIAASLPSGEDEGRFIVRTARHILEHTPEATIGVISRAGWRRRPIDTVFDETDLQVRKWDLAIDNGGVVEMLQMAAAGLGQDFGPDALLAAALDRVDLSDIETRTELSDAVTQLRALAATTGSISEALVQVRDPGASDVPIPAGVHLLNAHVGKGQQFDWVFIPGFEEGHIPSFLAKTPADVAEEMRILLVMISRARHGVVVTRANQLISKKGNPYGTTHCRWSSLLLGGIDMSGDALASHIQTLTAYPGGA